MLVDESLEFLERGGTLPGACETRGEVLDLASIDEDHVVPWRATIRHEREGRDHRGPHDQEVNQRLPKESSHGSRSSFGYFAGEYQMGDV